MAGMQHGLSDRKQQSHNKMCYLWGFGGAGNQPDLRKFCRDSKRHVTSAGFKIKKNRHLFQMGKCS